MPDQRRGRRVVRPMTALQAAMAQSVSEVLREHSLSQSALAAMLGISEKHLSQLLTGADAGSLATWNLMLHTVGVTRIDIEWSASANRSGVADKPA